jgi:hypothetical protein
MHNSETLSALGSQERGPRQTQHNTENENT